MFIRLVYSVTGLDLEARLVEFLEGRRSVEEVRDVSPQQLEELNRLQMETVKEEERLTSELARVQEEIAEQTVVGIAMRAKEAAAEEELERALEKQVDGEMLRIMEAADKLRMRTLNHLTEILRPLQAVMFLASSKRLHLCVRQWGKRTDQRHGRDAVS
ncbi:protein DOG1-like 3 [Momordica charantia]|uniref:Protein DOG1-like 3 n=1 Tax=Momordica charantia TaxID=3673 RepID=A0A6J1CN32_MOMCH|nr:protein DOG1-like 3 [Momordica charantia]